MVHLEIDKYTRKIIIIFAIFFLSIILVWIFLYSAKTRQIHNMKNQITQLDENFAKIQAIIMREATIRDGLLKLKRDYLSLRSKFPARLQDVMKELSSFSRKYKLVITSITPRLEGALENPKGEAFRIGNATCWVVRFNIVAHGGFVNMGRYLEALTGDFPFVITIESFDIRKSGRGASSMQANIVLNAYLLN